jgi:hypothetical protein
VHCTATDAHGNSSSASFHVTVVDTTPPVISSVPADITAEATGPSGAMVSYTNPTATDLVDVNDPVSCVPTSGATFPLGTTTVHCTATDAHGNSSSASFHVTVHDTTAPVITVPSDITAEATGPSGAMVSYSANATDVVGVTSFSCTPASGSAFGIGTTTVTCTASDAAGNSATNSFHITVVDTTGPMFSNVPADITVNTTGTSAVVTWMDPTANDLVDGPRPVTCTPASGSTFALGTTTVTCTASDTRGNTSTASFTVTVNHVQDTTPPVITVPADISAEATSPAGAVVTYTATATDNVAVATFGCTPASGSTFPLGTTTVTCTATDTSGNTSTATFHVTVRDTTKPVVTPPANVTANATSPAGAVVTYPAATAVDNIDGPIPAPCTPASGTTFPIGQTTVTCSATDAHGNTGTATFVVTVLGAHQQLVTLEGKVNTATELNDTKAHIRLKNTLIRNLTGADTSNHKKACSGISSFISAVTSNTPPITAAHRTDWLADANRIAAVNGC